MPRRLALLLALLLALPLIAHAAEGSFERTLKVTGPVDLDVSTGSGSITVRSGDASSVIVRGTIRVNFLDPNGADKVRRLEQDPPIVQNGNAIRIGRIEEEELRRHVSISYEVVVPQPAKVRSQSGSGSHTVEGVNGPVTSESGSGSITLRNIASAVRATAGSGSLRLENIQGEVHAQTGSGSIHADNIGGAFEAQTGSGGVHMTQTAPGNVRVQTGSGGVEVENVKGTLRVNTGSGRITAGGTPTGRWDLETASGSVDVRLPQQVGFELYAQTGSGRIFVDHPLTQQGTKSRREVRGTVRGGGSILDVRTSSGTIRIQ